MNYIHETFEDISNEDLEILIENNACIEEDDDSITVEYSGVSIEEYMNIDTILVDYRD